MPSFSLLTAIFMAFAVSALIMLVLFYLRFLKINAQATSAWAMAFACISARHFCSSLTATDFPLFAIGVDFFLLGFASFLWLGTYLFNDKQVPYPKIMLLFACSSLWIMVAYLTKIEIFWRVFPVQIAAGAVILVSASSFLQTYHQQKKSAYAVLAGAMLLKGMHQIDFLFLRELPNFVPMSFLFGSFLDLSIGMMLLVVSVLEQQNRAERLYANLQNELDERKLAESVLKERESLFEKVFQLVPDVLVIAREDDGSYVELNCHWEHVTGYSRSESLGKRALDLGLWVDVSKREFLYDTMRSKREIRNMETQFRHKNGQIFFVLISGTCFTVAGEAFVLYVMQDITDQHQREISRQATVMQLSERESVLATVFQLVPDTLTITSMADGRYVDVNRNWAPLSGFSPDEAVGRTSTELNIWVYPEQRTKMVEAILAEGEIRNMIISFRHKDGHVFQCRVSGTKFETSDGKYLLLSARNIDQEIATENARLLAEKEIHEMTTQLEARVVQRTIKLEHANHELALAMESLKYTHDELVRSEKMAALGSLVAGVAHELNTPIGNSVTVASTMQHQTQHMLKVLSEGGLRKSSLKHYLENIQHGSEILMRTLGMASELIRSFKQVAVDQSSNQRRVFDLKDALQEVVSTLKPMYKATPYSLVLDLAANIQMDSFPGPLGQIVTNFMTNALSHAFEGRVEGEMHIYSKLLDEHHAAVVFSDNGLGISDVNKRKVFDPFFTTKLGQGGSGLGLNIAYNLVTGVLGGTLKLESKLEYGTRFTMVLPLAAPEILAEPQNVE
jgi:PAS domain S-box-containing protein